MKVIGVIPARYGSSRMPGKPLADICGKPMIWWVYNRSKEAKKTDEIFVATDDGRISNACEFYGIPYVMTGEHSTAAERIQEVSEKVDADFYVGINGDEPLINPSCIDAVIPEEVPLDRPFGTNIITEMHEPSEVADPSNIKMVFDAEMNARYMSRTPIPFPYKAIDFHYYKHVGVIGYNRKMLDFYKDSVPGRFERIEGIDTLRFLDYGIQLKLTEVKGLKILSVDTPKDMEKIRGIISRGGIRA